MPGNKKARTSSLEAKPGRLVLARHGRPALDRSKWITSKEYYHWWQDYEVGGLDSKSKPPQNLIDIANSSDKVLSSIRPRAVETALALADEARIVQNEVFVEAALPSPPFPLIRLLPSIWDIFSRALWWFGMSRGEESKSQAETRVFAAVDVLEEAATDGNDVLLCAHGWFNRMMRPVLQGRGWDCIYDGRDKYWSFRVYEKR
jgi:broad specificity phosphatase PhoE